MSKLAWVLDHVGIAVCDLHDAETIYQRLGFKLTPRSIHSGTVTPGGPVVPMGSGNHCVMLRAGYIELLGTIDDSRPSFATSMLARYPGAHIIAFGCEDADSAYKELKKREPNVQPPAALEREAIFGINNDHIKRARFRNIYLTPEAFTPAKLIFIEHQTPEVLWQAYLLEHPNTAQSLVEVALCVEDVTVTGTHLGRMLGIECDIKKPGIAALDVDRGRIYLLSPETVPQWAKGVAPPAVPSVVGLGIGVKDIQICQQVLSDAGIDFNAHPYPGIWLAPETALGSVLSFVQISSASPKARAKASRCFTAQ